MFADDYYLDSDQSDSEKEDYATDEDEDNRMRTTVLALVAPGNNDVVYLK